MALLERLRRQFGVIHRPALTAAQLEFWAEYGYLVLPRFFDDDSVDAVNEHVDRLWDQRRQVSAPIVLDYLLETDRADRSLLRDSPEDVRDWPYKLNDLYLGADPVRALAAAPALMGVLSMLLDGEPMVINTLNFERGSQQADHFDTFYMPAPVSNKMVATWIALEDIASSTGPLQYYPGSNALEPFRFSHGATWAVPEEFHDALKVIRDRLSAARLKATTFTPRKGDVFIWHSQLLHGGSHIEDLKRTRKSLVTHYFRVSDFDLAKRLEMDADEVRRQFEAVGPSWRDAFLRPVIRRTAEGQALLDKWAVPQGTSSIPT
jgi:phytanoyl-CoA hydroxylase